MSSFLLHLSIALPASAGVQVVDCNNGPHYDITSAILAASAGDVIAVQPCTYRESVETFGKSVSIVASDPSAVGAIATGVGALPDSSVIIDGSGLSDCLTVTGGQDMVITGLKLVGCGGHGVNVQSALRLTIHGNRIQGATLAGIHIGSGAATVRITGNAIGLNGGSGIVSDATAVYVADNRIARNEGSGIQAFGRQSVLVDNDILANGIDQPYGPWDGIFLAGATEARVLRNTSRRNRDAGIRLSATSDVGAVGNDTDGSGVIDDGTGSEVDSNR